MAKKTKKTTTKAKKSTKGKQTEIPGTERPTTPAIEEAAAALRETRTEWQALGRKMAEQEDALVEVMTAEKCSLYKFSDGEEDLIVKLSETKKKVSIKKAKAPTSMKAEG